MQSFAWICSVSLRKKSHSPKGIQERQISFRKKNFLSKTRFEYVWTRRRDLPFAEPGVHTGFSSFRARLEAWPQDAGGKWRVDPPFGSGGLILDLLKNP